MGIHQQKCHPDENKRLRWFVLTPFSAAYVPSSKPAPRFYADHLYREAFHLPTVVVSVGDLLLFVFSLRVQTTITY